MNKSNVLRITVCASADFGGCFGLTPTSMAGKDYSYLNDFDGLVLAALSV